MNRAYTVVMSTFPELPRNQRIVFQHTAGPHADLYQIIGHSDQFGGRAPDTQSQPFTVEFPPPARENVVATLVQSKPRYLLYRELTNPTGLGTFDRSQR